MTTLVTRYTAGYPNPNNVSGYSCVAHEAQANVKCSFFNIAVGNGDAINSIYKLARIPSNAMIMPQSTLYSGGIAGLTSLSVGINNRAGTVLDTALMSAVDVHTAGSFAMLSNVASTNYFERLWQLLGLTTDPGSVLDIEALVGAAPTAAGVLIGHIFWTVPGL